MLYYIQSFFRFLHILIYLTELLKKEGKMKKNIALITGTGTPHFSGFRYNGGKYIEEWVCGQLARAIPVKEFGTDAFLETLDVDPEDLILTQSDGVPEPIAIQPATEDIKENGWHTCTNGQKEFWRDGVLREVRSPYSHEHLRETEQEVQEETDFNENFDPKNPVKASCYKAYVERPSGVKAFQVRY